MKIKHMVGLLVLVAVIFFGTVFMFVFKTFAPSTRDIQNNPVVSQSASTSQSSNSNSNSSIIPTNTEAPIEIPFSDQESLTPATLSVCATQKKTEAGGRQYEKGSILVTFYDAMDFETAVKSVQLLGLETEDSLTARNNFRQNHWLEATGIPATSEFWIQCQLEGSEGVKRTSLNYLFSLRQ